MYLGIMVQMDTIGPVWGTVGGQKWPKMDPKILTISENEKKMNQIHKQDLYFG